MNTRPRKSFKPQVTVLEDRTLLSTSPAVAARLATVPPPDRIVTDPIVPQSPSSLAGIDLSTVPAARPTYIQLHPANGGSATPGGGYSPAQIRHAYGIDLIKFGSVVGNGAGQTIAIIDAYDDPAFVSSTSANFATSDFHRFDVQYGLPDPPSFKKVNQTGGVAYPATDPAGAGAAGSWETETALDLEWAHAIAPKANIILIEANTSAGADLFSAVAYAATIPSVTVVSMSFGSSEFAGETALDAVLKTPAGHAPITFLASTGDGGQPGGYPSFSPNVVAVGGTTLTASGPGNYVKEVAWSGSGGGVSQFEPKPSYQNPLATQSATFRSIPDVAFDADPNSGVAVYDSYDNADGKGPWIVVGGTSFACPAWAGIIAIANQGRAAGGLSSLEGRSQTLPKIYTMPAGDFHDILTGNNGFAAGPGYDLTTGRGSPKALLVVAALSATISSPLSSLRVFMPSRYIYDAATGLYSGYVTLANTTNYPITGPFTLTMASGRAVSLANAASLISGKSAISVASSVGAHSSLHIYVQFSNPGHVNLSSYYFNMDIMVGA